MGEEFPSVVLRDQGMGEEFYLCSVCPSEGPGNGERGFFCVLCVPLRDQGVGEEFPCAALSDRGMGKSFICVTHDLLRDKEWGKSFPVLL